MLSELKVKVKSGWDNNTGHPGLKSIISNDTCVQVSSPNGIKNALNAFIGNSNLLKPKPVDNTPSYDHLYKKNIAHCKPEVASKQQAEVRKKVPKVDIFNYPFNNLVETNSKYINNV
jgi:hypothetical protein